MFPLPHWDLGFIAFAVLPYISLTMLILGSLYRYLKNPYGWNSESSELLEKDASMKYGSILFHYGILIALAGHVVGMLVPQWCYNAIGVSESMHIIFAVYSGIPIGIAALAGLLLLTGRRLLKKRVLSNSSPGDFLTLALLLIVIGLGTYNVTFVRYGNVLNDIAPWLRSIFIFAPAPELLEKVPLTYKVHFVAVFALFAFYPFSRLVHITSAPLTYLWRVYLLFRRRCEGY